MSTGIAGRIGRALLLALGLAAGLAPTAAASTFLGGRLSWKPVQGAPKTAAFSVWTGFVRSAYAGNGTDGFPVVGDQFVDNVAGSRLEFGNGSVSSILTFRVKAVSPTQDWMECVAIDASGKERVEHTYATAGPFTARLVGCCRPAGVAIAPLAPFRIESRVDFTAAPFGAPTAGVPPVAIFQQGKLNSMPFRMASSSIDPSENLTVRFASAGEFGAPWSAPSGMSIGKLDVALGVLTWNTAAQAGAVAGSAWPVQIVIEDHAGSASGPVKSKAVLDMLVRITGDDADPAPSIAFGGGLACGGEVVLQAGVPFAFTATVQDVADQAIVHLIGMPSGMTASVVPPIGSPVSIAGQWTPTASDSGAHVVTVLATDLSGDMSLCSVVLQVISAPTLSLGNGLACGSTVAVKASQTLVFQVTGVDPDAGDILEL
jgi:hypothetical protein